MTPAVFDASVIERDFLRAVDFTCGYEECVDALLQRVAAALPAASSISFHYLWSEILCIFERTSDGFLYSESDPVAGQPKGIFQVAGAGVDAQAINLLSACGVWVIEEKRRRDAAALLRQRKAFYSLVGLVIHNIKNPVSGISGFAQLLQVKAVDATMQEYCRIILESIEQLGRINTDLIAFVNGEPMQLALEPLALGPFLDGTIRKTVETYRHAGISVIAEPSPLLTISANKDRLAKCFSVIFGNARESMAHGGTITVSYELGDHDLRIIVADTGHGMPVFVREQACEMLYSHGKVNAPGLGLAQAKSIIAAHGGALALSSRYGRGTTVTISIPIHRSPSVS